MIALEHCPVTAVSCLPIPSESPEDKDLTRVISASLDATAGPGTEEVLGCSPQPWESSEGSSRSSRNHPAQKASLAPVSTQELAFYRFGPQRFSL